MSIVSLITFLGGLGLFLCGMRLLGDAIARQTGGRLKRALGRLDDAPLGGLLLGAGVTAVIQSSGAATVMVLGFVDSGVMTLRTAAAAIFGANVGTTVTGWLLALGGEGGDGGRGMLRLLRPDSLAALLAFAAALLQLQGKRERSRDLGSGMLGFAVLLFGMGAMSGAMAPLRDSALFRRSLTVLDRPLPGVAAGFLLAALLQSSSAAVGVVQAAAASGAVTAANALPLIMGINVGAGGIVLLAAVGMERDARRAAWVYVLHNLLTMFAFLIPLTLTELSGGGGALHLSLNAADVALLHTCYKTAGAALQLPLVDPLLRLTDRIVGPNACVKK